MEIGTALCKELTTVDGSELTKSQVVYSEKRVRHTSHPLGYQSLLYPVQSMRLPTSAFLLA